MAFRCINAFSTDARTVAGGALVEDDDPILSTHAAHFVRVEIPAAPAAEQATTARTRTRRKASVKKVSDGGDASAAADA